MSQFYQSISLCIRCSPAIYPAASTFTWSVKKIRLSLGTGQHAAHSQLSGRHAGTLTRLWAAGHDKNSQGMLCTAHEMMSTLSAVLLKYEPRLKKITVALLEQQVSGELRYAIDAEIKGVGLVRYGTEFMPEGRVLLRHLKQQQYFG